MAPKSAIAATFELLEASCANSDHALLRSSVPQRGKGTCAIQTYLPEDLNKRAPALYCLRA
jgi:hypothetical protein